MALKGVKVNGTTYPFDYNFLVNKPVIDSALSDSSENAVQNKAVKAALDSLGAALGGDKSPVIIDTASGSVASFTDGADDMPVKRLEVAIDPVQDLHGYDSPWPAGGGKNLLRLNRTGTIEQGGIRCTVNPDGSVTLNGTTASSNWFLNLNYVNGSTLSVPKGVDLIVNGSSETAPVCVGVYCPGNIAESGNGADAAFRIPEDAVVSWCRIGIWRAGVTVENVTVYPMIRLASETDPSFAPYSNICPISGRTGANVVISPTLDAQDGTTYSLNWQTEAGTVYGGNATYLGGGNWRLTVTMAMVDLGTLNWLRTTSYANPVFYTKVSAKKIGENNLFCSIYPCGNGTAGNAANGADKRLWNSPVNEQIFIRDDAYSDTASFTAAMSGVQLVYELATPLTYTLTTAELINSLYGINNIWADTGDVSVSYPADTKLYIDRKIAEATA